MLSLDLHSLLSEMSGAFPREELKTNKTKRGHKMTVTVKFEWGKRCSRG
jgi:hypothetical protein